MNQVLIAHTMPKKWHTCKNTTD